MGAVRPFRPPLLKPAVPVKMVFIVPREVPVSGGKYTPLRHHMRPYRKTLKSGSTAQRRKVEAQTFVGIPLGVWPAGGCHCSGLGASLVPPLCRSLRVCLAWVSSPFFSPQGRHLQNLPVSGIPAVVTPDDQVASPRRHKTPKPPASVTLSVLGLRFVVP